MNACKMDISLYIRFFSSPSSRRYCWLLCMPCWWGALSMLQATDQKEKYEHTKKQTNESIDLPTNIDIVYVLVI